MNSKEQDSVSLWHIHREFLAGYEPHFGRNETPESDFVPMLVPDDGDAGTRLSLHHIVSPDYETIGEAS